MATTSFGPMRQLGETQLQIQFALFSAYDARAIGVLAVDAALAAVATAAAQSIGRFWWLSLIGLCLAGLPCVVALGTGGQEKALDIETAFADGAAVEVAVMDRLLATSIAEAIAQNNKDLQTERTLSSIAVFQIGITIFTAIAIPLLY